MNHFTPPLWPRTISTRATQNRQVKVHSKEEAMKHYEKSDFIDCRISVFGQNEQEKIIPNCIFIDLDNRDALNETLILFHKTISGKPLVLDTGRGLAILQPIAMKSWLGLTHGNKDGYELSKLLLQWTERYLTNHKCDLANHPSLKNTLIRVPGTFNSKLIEIGKSLPESEVKIVYGWDGNRPQIEHIRPKFIKHVKKILEKEKQISTVSKINPKKFQWIEKLLKCKLEDGRERLLFDVSRYLINIKKMSVGEASDKIYSWLDSRYYSKSLIITKCKYALKDKKFPRKLQTIKETDPELYGIISKKLAISE